jgi:hypothetical protein
MELVKIISFFCAVIVANNVSAIPIEGIEFPGGVASFADDVVSYSPGSDVTSNYINPSNALGVPDINGFNGATSLGEGGELVLRFTDNSLTASGDASADLWIFEVGDVTEFFNVAISTDNFNWINLGDVLGQPTGIDIDSIASVTTGVSYSFVRLRDILPNQTNSPSGEADIDAVGAISSAPSVFVPEPSFLALISIGFAGLGCFFRKLLWFRIIFS